MPVHNVTGLTNTNSQKFSSVINLFSTNSYASATTSYMSGTSQCPMSELKIAFSLASKGFTLVLSGPSKMLLNISLLSNPGSCGILLLYCSKTYLKDHLGKSDTLAHCKESTGWLPKQCHSYPAAAVTVSGLAGVAAKASIRRRRSAIRSPYSALKSASRA
jgi:hypothetical protein